MTRYFFAKHISSKLTSDIFSLAWKGLSLERRLGSPKFFFTIIILTIASRSKIVNKLFQLFHQGKCNVINILTSSLFYVLLALLGSELLEDYSIMRQCAIGGDQGPKKDWRFVDNQTGEQSILNKKQKAWKDDFFFPFRIQWSPLCLKSCQQLPQSQVAQ